MTKTIRIYKEFSNHGIDGLADIRVEELFLYACLHTIEIHFNENVGVRVTSCKGALIRNWTGALSI